MAIQTNLLGTEENITMMNGDSFFMSWSISDSAGDPLDLTAASELKIQVRKKQNITSELIFEATVGDGISISGNGNEVAEVNKVCSGDDGTWFWNFQITHASGRIETVRYGKFTLTSQVTD